ncbi:MAG: hypothetical protein AAFQ74_04620 [Cyanobacteria bacterium J06623_4]
MPFFSSLRPSRPSRRRNRLMAALLLVSMFTHPVEHVLAQTLPSTINRATAEYTSPSTGANPPIQNSAISNPIEHNVTLPLIDPSGRLLGCDGEALDSYAGFSMALFETDSSGFLPGGLVELSTTTGDDSIPPNTANINPFPLSSEGTYNFLLDETQGQTNAGTNYILVIDPPENSPFSERRILIEMLGVTRVDALSSAVLSYRATSLDGQPISIDGETEISRSIEIRDAEFQSLTLFELGVDSIICEENQLSITKSADRSAAQPGDVIVYRLNVQNVAPVAVESVTAIDTLPVGFELITDSVSAQNGETIVDITTQHVGNDVRFVAGEPLGAGQTLDIIYAVRITPDALRGSGRNSALITGRRSDSQFRLQDGPSFHRTTLDPGILSDCGTLIGRVFEDKNFDGEQQPGEAGIPNAVIFLDDGNRVVTDADGLFSVQKMLPGQRTGTLDLSSLPGYTLAPNLNFIERNSHSRLVNLAPGGLVRMNFGVTPSFSEVQE